MTSAARDGQLSARQRTPGQGRQEPQALELAAAARVEDDLGHVVRAQPQLLSYLVRPETLLVVQQCKPLLRPAPRLADHLGNGGSLRRLSAVTGEPFWHRGASRRGGGSR